LVWYYSFSLISIIAIICLVLTLRTLLGLNFEFNHKKYNYQAFLYLILGITFVILIKFFAHTPSAYINALLNLSADKFSWLITIGLWNVVLEEFLFRGLLWMILSKWMLDNDKILITQASLFWLVHMNLIIGPSFGIYAFIIGLWVGYLALSSKSLIPGTITHFVWNIMANLITT
jgi:membrane protease YdiL (CAAX protease family)